jgi:hypothetical protein
LKVKKRLKAQYGRESAGSRELDDKEVKAVSHPTEVIHPAMSAPMVRVRPSSFSTIFSLVSGSEEEVGGRNL